MTPSLPVSELKVGKAYTLIIPTTRFQYQDFYGTVAAVEGVHVRRHEIDAPTEFAATIVFTIWDKKNDTPYGYPANWIAKVEDFSDYDFALGQTVTLKDREGKWGTARITVLGQRELSLANFTGALKVWMQAC